jgi:serine protease Do
MFAPTIARRLHGVFGALAMSLLALTLIGLPAQHAQAQARALPDFTDLVEQVGPSVVNIRTIQKVSGRQQQSGPGDEEMMEFFRRFGLPMPNMPRQAPRSNRGAPEEEVPRGVGSGFIFSQDGLIMTNAHVIDGADEVLVTLTDKREFKAKIIGADKRSDVALVKIEATGLTPVKVGDVGRLKVGEWVMAIGSPFGFENTVTAGIVSAKQRYTDDTDYLPFIQTDVAINPGNSGGPLINMRGEVVGINSQIYSRSGGFMGISFSIPMDEAVRVVEQLRSQGRVSRGRIGVGIAPVSKELAESLGLPKAQGALVTSVEAGAPADKAGVEPGDIILKLNGKSIEKSIDLPRAVGEIKPGSKATVTVQRRGTTKELNVTVAEIEAEKAAAKAVPSEPKPKAAAAQALGLTVSELTEAQKKELRVKGGVSVEAATEQAARAGLRQGDVILAIGNVEVASVKEFETVVAKLDKNKSINVLFRRGEWTQYALIKAAN